LTAKLSIFFETHKKLANNLINKKEITLQINS
jgi:hypothetical protein